MCIFQLSKYLEILTLKKKYCILNKTSTEFEVLLNMTQQPKRARSVQILQKQNF